MSSSKYQFASLAEGKKEGIGQILNTIKVVLGTVSHIFYISNVNMSFINDCCKFNE